MFYYICGMFLLVCTINSFKSIVVKYSIPIEQGIFVRSVLIVLFTIPIMIRDKPFDISKAEMSLHIKRNFIFAISTFFWYRGVVGTSVNNSTLISFLTPFLSSLAAIYVFKEKMSVYTFLALIVCLATTIWLKGSSLDFSPFAFTMLMVAVLMRVVVILITKQIANKFSSKNIIHYNNIVMAIASAHAVFHWKTIPIEAYIGLFIAGIFFCSEVMLVTKAYQLCSVSVLQPIDFTKIAFSMLISFLLLGEKTTKPQVIASVLIVGANLFSLYFNGKSKR